MKAACTSFCFFLVLSFFVSSLPLQLQAQPCMDPVIDMVTSDATDICAGAEVTLMVSGTLNDATDWYWYTGDCGTDLVGNGAELTVAPGATTTYFVQGEPACPGNPPCGSIEITVEVDTEAPSLTIPADVTVNCEADLEPAIGACGPLALLHGSLALSLPMSGVAAVEAALFDKASASQCDNEPLSFSYSPISSDNSENFTCDDIGANSVTIWVTDAQGHQVSAQVMLHVTDVFDDCNNGGGCRPMALVYEGLAVSLDETGAATVSASAFDYASEDLCNSGGLTFSFSSDTNDTALELDCDDLGTVEVQVWVTDNNGNQSYTEARLVVQDLLGACGAGVMGCLPVLIFEEHLVGTLPPNRQLTIAAAIFDQASQENCGPGNWNFVYTGNQSGSSYTFTCENLGAQTLTIVGNNGAGSTGHAQVQLTLQDNQGNCEGVGFALATDDCDPAPAITYQDAETPGSCAGEATITRTWTATDAAGNALSLDQLITIQDTTPPIILCPEEQVAIFGMDCQFEVPNYTGMVAAGDNCDTAPTLSQSPIAGTFLASTTTITIFATDACGNVGSCNFNLVLTDETAPELECPADQVGVIDTDCSFELPDYSDLLILDDNCDDNPQVAQSPAPGMAITEATTVNITVIDGSSNTSSCSFMVTLPSGAPVLSDTPADLTVNCASDVPGDQEIFADDDCDGVVLVTFTQTGFPLDCPGQGLVVNTWAATDSDGNTVSHTQTITVNDTQAPILTALPGDLTVGCLAEVPGDQGITATDNCDASIQVVFFQSEAPACGGSGTIVNTWVAQDCSGNSKIHTQTVTIENTDPPSLSDFPADLTLDCLGDVPGDQGVTATDNCGAEIEVVFEQSQLPGCNGTGTITNTWTATDCAGNSTSYTQTITIDDTEDPVLSELPTAITVTCTSDVPGDPGITATDNCDIAVAVTFEQSAFPVCPGSGTVTNTWTATDCAGNTTTHVQTVTIADVEAPVLSALPEDITVTCADEVPTNPGLTAFDNCDGLVSVVYQTSGFPPGCVGSGTVTNTWTATDCAGNSVTHTQTILIQDTTAPSLSATPGDLTVDCLADVPGEAGVFASDDCDGSVVVVFEQDTLPGCNGEGTVVNTWTATDCAGNSSSHSQTVTIEDNEAPVLSLLPVDQTVGCVSNVPGNPGIIATDNCGETLTVTFEQIGLPLDCVGSGTVENTWTVTDCAGNTTTHTQTITIDDNTVPVLSTKPTNTTVACVDDIPGDPGVTATDACEGSVDVLFTQTGLPFDYLNPAPVLNTWTATDCAGNTTTHTQIVTVVDEEAPEALCQNLTLNLEATGTVTLTPEMINNGSLDNCGALTMSVVPTQFTCADVGVQTATLTVTDLFNNTSTCSSTVSVIASANCALPAIAFAGGPNISDPCVCLSDGEFEEEVVVGPSGVGQSWQVVSTTLLNPNTNQPFIPFTYLTEVMTGNDESIYTIQGIHNDGVGYEIVVESPFYPGQTLTISNTCYYPQPQIVGLEGPYCLLTDEIELMGEANGASLIEESFTINGNAATVFDPQLLGVGTHTIEYTVNAGTAAPADIEDPGCVASVSQTVQIVQTPATLACNNNLSISIDQNCEVFIDPDFILEGNYLCYDDYAVTVFSGPNQIPNPVSGDYAGLTLTVRVTHLISGNFCWSTVTIQDLLGPVFDCPTAPTVIYCTEDYNDLPPPPATDNCSTISYQLTGEVFIDNDACDDGAVRVQRTWIALDEEGSESQPCTETIEILRPDGVDFPNDIIWSCLQYADFANITDPVALHPAIAALQNGIQTIDASDNTNFNTLANTGSGIPLDLDGQFCNYNYSSSDQIIASCGSTFKILRTWTVLDWCTSNVITLNQQGEDNVQLITIQDDVAPAINIPAFSVSANIPGVHPQPCASDGLLLAPIVSDDCNNYTIRIYTPVGEAIYLNGTDGAQGGYIPAPGLTLGFHNIIYQAEDACGNISELTYQLQVIDDITPSAVCDEITEVSLSSNGLAVILATVFDDGSADNCCLDNFQVRRMDDNCNLPSNNVFGPTVTFCCEDADNTPHLVQMRVFDCFGNFNECMVQVFVEDKLPPSVVQCPSNETITCDTYLDNFAAAIAAEDYEVLDVFGTPQFYDNCEAIITPSVEVTINSCAEGTILRSWTAVDPSNNSPVTCSQTINVEHVSEWVVQFPDDIYGTCEDGSLPDFGEPVIFFDDCEMIGTSFDDMYFYVVPDACFKIVRTWTVVNWCIYEDYGYNAFFEFSEAEVSQDFDGDGDFDDRTYKDGVNNGTAPDGYIVYNQVIKVDDLDAPEFTVDDVDVCIFGNGCTTQVTLPTPSVVDCSEEVEIEITTDLPNGNGFGPYQNVGTGIYTATYGVTDNCGNTTYQTIEITVEDCKKPTPYCKAGLVVEMMQTGMVPVPATLINDQSFDNCPGTLQFSFSPDVNDNTVIFDCEQLGQQELELWVTDASGNQDFCETFVIVQDNMGACIEDITIGGLIMTQIDEPVEGVQVDINSGLFTYFTNQAGMYTTDLLPVGNDYSVRPTMDLEPINGVTTLDMVFIQLHILNVQPLDSPYKMIAADANNSGAVTTLDNVILQKMILLLLNEFPNNTSWRFINADYIFPDPGNPWSQPFPEVMNFNNLEEALDDADFVAVKVGDVNLTAATHPDLASSDDRADLPVRYFRTAEQKLEKGQYLEVPIYAPDLAIYGCQFTLDFDTDALRLEELIPGGFALDNIGTALVSEGGLTVSWSAPEARAWKDEVLFTLRLEVKKDGWLSNYLHLHDRLIAAEAYDANLNSYRADLQFDEQTASAAPYLYQNTPNPYYKHTVIGFYLPNAGSATLTIFDAKGAIERVIEGNYSKGYHEVRIEDLQATGVLIYQLETTEATIARKMIKME